MSLSTAAEWAEAADALARERQAYGTDPGRFPIVLGINEPDALRQWCALDAVDSIERIEEEVPSAQAAAREQFPPVPPDAVARAYVASYLATHTQLGIEIGLWLAQTGRVKP